MKRKEIKKLQNTARDLPQLNLLSVIIPAHNEEDAIAPMVKHLILELDLQKVPHEIVVVDDGSTDKTWENLCQLKKQYKQLNPVQNKATDEDANTNVIVNGFGRAIQCGLKNYSGDAVVIMMADESDDCRDAVLYWQKLNEGYDCVFGSRFVKGGGTIDYPIIKYAFNRLANKFIQYMFNIKLNDTTNAFKAYRRYVIDGCSPLLSPHFNITVEIPLKAIVRGYTWTIMPITWKNRRTGIAKLKINEMGSRYFFIVMYIWLEKYFSKGDYKKTKIN